VYVGGLIIQIDTSELSSSVMTLVMFRNSVLLTNICQGFNDCCVSLFGTEWLVQHTNFYQVFRAIILHTQKILAMFNMLARSLVQ
jgi:hypothetical protein